VVGLSLGKGGMGNSRPLGCAWYLTGVCNYRCPYCYDQAKPETHPTVDMADVELIFGALTERRGPLEIALTGGEPSLHPAFEALLSYFSRNGHALLVSTNLSRGPEPFLRAVARPERCSINASFHPSHANIDQFGRSLQRLAEAGFPISPSYVLYPPNAAMLPRYEEKLRAYLSDVSLVGMTFVGEHGGVRHPLPPAGVPAAGGVPPGRYCRAGQDYFAILADGTIVRCVEGVPLRGDHWPLVHLDDRPAPCPSPHCFCSSMHHLWVDGTSPA